MASKVPWGSSSIDSSPWTNSSTLPTDWNLSEESSTDWVAGELRTLFFLVTEANDFILTEAGEKIGVYYSD